VKKIITNTKMQKIMCTILLIMILFQFCFPNVVLAKIEGDNYKDDAVADTYDNWINILPQNSIKIEDFDEAIKNYIIDTYTSSFGDKASNVAQIIFDKRKVKGTLVVWAELYEYGDSLEVMVEGVWDKEYLAEGIEYDNTEKTSFFGNYKNQEHITKFLMDYVLQELWKTDTGGDDSETEGPAITTEIFEYGEFKEFIGESSDEIVYSIIEEKLKEFIRNTISGQGYGDMEEAIPDLTKYIFEKYTETDENGNTRYIHTINITVEGPTDADGKLTNTDYQVKNVTISPYDVLQFDTDFHEWEKAEGVASADAGGFLMDLVFPFINFVADGLLSILGRVMNDGEDGLKAKRIEPSDEVKSNLTKDDVIKVDVRSFKNLIGMTAYKNYVVTYSPEKIFSGEIALLNIDFISGKTSDGQEIEDVGWNNIRQVIAQWYKVLRMVAIIGLLSVLIYTGIKIIISSNAKDKAKFKEWIINWFIAVAILFLMHYIMSFIVAVTGQVSQLVSGSAQNIIIEECENGVYSSTINKDNLFITNLMGYVRFMVQSDDWTSKIGYEVMFIALVVYTFKFTFIYLKRVLNMAFLTLIAPIVALTYPIDKINDGNAQGFQMWLKEYIFNALLQPMHCILYYILLSSAMGVAAKNPLYAIIVLMFMTEAEKLLKQIFGFSKAGAGTVGGMTGAFAAGALASNVKNIAKMAGKLSNGGDGGSGNDKNPLDNPKPTQGNDFSEFDGDNPQSNEQLLGDGQDQDNGQTGDNGQGQNVNDQQSVQQRMLDAYDENYGTDQWDAQERDAMARDAHQPNSTGMTDAETREMLREQGWSEEQINDTLGEPEPEQQQQPQPAQQPVPQPQPAQQPVPQPQPAPQPFPQRNPQPAQQPADRGDSVRTKTGVGAGLKAVGKKLVKPIWDCDRSGRYNGMRLARKIGKGVFGATVGITAAAVQAGISITDGKYNPMEGLATFGAGFAGGTGIIGGLDRGIGGIVNTYREGATGGDKKELRKLQMERAQQRFADRDDVIEFNKREYPTAPKAAMERQRDHYLPSGVTDLKEMKSCMKYADTLQGMSKEAADRRAAQVANFKKQLKDQGQTGAVYDRKKQEEYINAMVKQAAPEDAAKIKTRYTNLFNAVQAFDKAQN